MKRKTHKCAGRPEQIPPWFMACKRCWWRIPAHLRDALVTERHNCQLAGIKHTARLLELQADACKRLAAKAAQ